MWDWLNYDVVNTSISVAELLLALFSAVTGGAVVGVSSATRRLRVEKRLEILDALHAQEFGHRSFWQVDISAARSAAMEL